MSNTYISSNNVWMYPSALRGGTDSTTQTTIYDPQSRIGTESNLNSAVNRLTIDGSFVIDDSISSDGTLRFSIHGYYFKANVNEAISNLSNPNELWAGINIQSIGNTSAAYKIECLIAQDGSSQILDENDKFKGVNFFDTEPTGLGDGQYKLRLLVKSGNDYIVPASSYLRYDTNMISVNGTPLNEIIETDTSGNINITTDNLVLNKTLTANKIYSNNIEGDKGNILNGVATKAINITDASGNNKTIGSTSKPVYLNNGQLNEVSVIEVTKGGTGKSNLNDVKVGGASNADVSTKWTTGSAGGVYQSGNETVATTIYLSSGAPREGVTIWASPNSPNNSTGKNGDVWFKYN